MMPQLAGSLPPTWETERSAQCEPGRAPTVADVQRELGDWGGGGINARSLARALKFKKILII